MLSWTLSGENMPDGPGKKQGLMKIGFVSVILMACLVVAAWQAPNESGVNTRNQVSGLDGNAASVRVRANVDGLSPVMTKNGKPVRVAGSCVKTSPKKTKGAVAHVTLHLNGETENVNVTTDEGLTEHERRMINSLHKAAHPEEFVEAARLEFTHASGVKRSMVIHVRRDATKLGKFPIETKNPYANKTMTPSELEKITQDTQLSFTKDDSKVPLVDVLAGCELLAEGVRKFSLKQEGTAKGKKYTRYVEVKMILMTGCESTNGPIYGEFEEVETKTARSVACASRSVKVCQVETIDTTSMVVGALERYKKKHGDGPVDTESMKKVAADVIPPHVGKLNVKVAPDCFGQGYNFFLCVLAVMVAIPIAVVIIIVILTSENSATLDYAVPMLVNWLFSGLINQNGGGGGGGGCFPRGIGIMLMSGHAVNVENLSVGSAVWSFGEQRNSVYMNGHRDGGTVSEFVWIRTATGREVGASRGHFGIVFDEWSGNGQCHEWKAAGNVSWTREMFDVCHVHKRFEEFLEGQNEKWSVFVHGSGSGLSGIWLEEVTGAEVRMGVGLYNPYSMDGTLIANGIVVSAHSEFILDGVVPTDYAHVLPKVYQCMFSPLRLLYRMCPACAIETDRFLERGAGEHNALEVVKAIWCSFVQAQIGSLA